MADRDEQRARELYEKWLAVTFNPHDPVADSFMSALLEAITGEREACAKVCVALSGALWDQATHPNSVERGSLSCLGESDGAQQCAAAIRARGTVGA